MAQGVGYNFNPATVRSPGGVTTVRDLAGYMNHGQLVGSATIGSDATWDGILSIPSSGGAMTAAIPKSSYPLDTSGGMTVSAHFRLHAGGTGVRCIASASDGTHGWTIYASDASGHVTATINGTVYDTGVTISDTNWHHVAFVWHNSVAPANTVSAWVDGVERVTAASGPTAWTYSGTVNTTLSLGRVAADSSAPLNGDLGDFRWFNDPLADADIPTIAANEQADYLYASYPLDGTGADYSTYGRDLSVASGTWSTGQVFGKALTSGTASAAVNFGSVDRLTAFTVITVHSAPAAATDLINLTDGSGHKQYTLTLNTNGTLTFSVYLNTGATTGYQSVTTTGAVPTGTILPIALHLNPTYMQMQVANASVNPGQVTFGNPPALTPVCYNCNQLTIGNGANADLHYLTFVRNFIDPGTMALAYQAGVVTAGAYAPATAPVARYSFDVNGGTGTTVTDESGHGLDMTVTANGEWQTGHNGSGSSIHAKVTGSGKAAFYSGTTGWNATPPGFAVALWAKWHTPGSGVRILELWDGTTPALTMHRLNATDGRINIRIASDGVDATSGSVYALNPSPMAGVADNQWVHIVLSIDHYRVRGYVNGVPGLAEYASVWSMQGTDVYPSISHWTVGGDDSTDNGAGAVDSLWLFDRALGPSEAQYLYESDTKVTGAVALAWATRAATGGTKALQWNVRSQVAGSRSLRWNVRAAVVGTRSLAWAVRSAVADARGLQWATRAQASGSRSLRWNVRQAIAGARSLLWNVATQAPPVQVSGSLALAWRVRRAVTAALRLRWAVASNAVARVPDERTLAVLAESRVSPVLPEHRTVAILSESRTLCHPSERTAPYAVHP